MNDRSAGLKALPDLMGTPSSSKQVQTIGRWRLQGYHGQSTQSEIIDKIVTSRACPVAHK